MTDSTRARPGGGSVYQAADGFWKFAVRRPDGKRVVKASKDRAVVEALAEEHRATLPAPRTRQEQMEAARARGVHTASELYAMHAAAPKDCRYCGVSLNVFNEVVDHIIPVDGEGSDAADNLQVICWECNIAKGNRLDYSYTGKPRAFRPFPLREREYARFLAATSTGSEQ